MWFVLIKTSFIYKCWWKYNYFKCVWVSSSSFLLVQQESHLNFWYVFLATPMGTQKPPQGHAGLLQTHLLSYHKAWKKVLTVKHLLVSDRKVLMTQDLNRYGFWQPTTLCCVACVYVEGNQSFEGTSKWEITERSTKLFKVFQWSYGKKEKTSYWLNMKCNSWLLKLTCFFLAKKVEESECFSFTYQHKKLGSSYNMYSK